MHFVDQSGLLMLVCWFDVQLLGYSRILNIDVSLKQSNASCKNIFYEKCLLWRSNFLELIGLSQSFGEFRTPSLIWGWATFKTGLSFT